MTPEQFAAIERDIERRGPFIVWQGLGEFHYSCVPLTREEHREYDAGRDVFEQKYGLSMEAVVKELNGIWFAYAGRA